MTPDEVPDGPVLVDTDVATWLHSGRGRADSFGPLVANHVLCLAFVTVGELRFGALDAGWGDVRRDALEGFIRNFVILPADDAVSRIWARLHDGFRDQSGVNDEWIVACAAAQTPGLPIATGNVKHFKPMCDDLSLVLVHPDA